MKKLIALLVMASLISLSIGCGEKPTAKSTGVTKSTGSTGDTSATTKKE